MIMKAATARLICDQKRLLEMLALNLIPELKCIVVLIVNALFPIRAKQCCTSPTKNLATKPQKGAQKECGQTVDSYTRMQMV